MATTSEQIIIDLEALGANPRVIGYLTACQTFGYMQAVTGGSTAPGSPKMKSKGRAPRNKVSKAGQAILAVLTPEGMAKRAIVAATGLSVKTVEGSLATMMMKAGLIYVKNSRYFAGPNPTGTSAEGASRTKRAARSSAKAPTKLSEGVLTAVRSLPQGSTNAQIKAYLADSLGITALPNHVGIALKRHQRASRLETRGGVWYTPGQQELRPTG